MHYVHNVALVLACWAIFVWGIEHWWRYCLLRTAVTVKHHYTQDTDSHTETAFGGLCGHLLINLVQPGKFHFISGDQHLELKVMPQLINTHLIIILSNWTFINKKPQHNCFRRSNMKQILKTFFGLNYILNLLKKVCLYFMFEIVQGKSHNVSGLKLIKALKLIEGAAGD